MSNQAARYYPNRALGKHQRGNVHGAIADYSQAVRLQPNRYALVGRALACQALGELDQAEADYTAAIGLYPRFADAYHNRAVLRAERKNLPGALEDFERVGERLERRINEVAETQRLSEERFRQEWNSWNDDDQKRWKQFTLTNDESWRLHDKEYDLFRAKVTGIDDQIPVIQDHIDRLWGVERAKAEMYREQYQAIITDREKPAEKAVPSRSTSNGHGRK